MSKLSIEICERIKSVIGDSKVGLHEPFFNSLEKENLSNCIESSYVSSIGEYVNNFEKMKSNIYNFGLEDANLSKLELAQKIQNHINDLEILIDENRKDPDKRNYVVSNEKIESYGFKASRSLEQGIKELVCALPLLKRTQFANI